MKECPLGTTPNNKTMKCDGCAQGCAVCNVTNNAECIRCEPGLALLDTSCVAECIDGYKKSWDGSVCEIRTYPLNKAFVPFPWVITSILGFFVILISFKITRNTMVVQSTIAWLAFLFSAAIVFEFLGSLKE